MLCQSVVLGEGYICIVSRYGDGGAGKVINNSSRPCSTHMTDT